ncbi:hypothetical protein MMC15_006658 [Xylographa vitiligo]|nr:hypothetical protein [Xylographa vitiligo]
MPTKEPNPQLWTLRLKQHKVTVLLFVEQTQSFSSIKADLLDALKGRGYTEINQRFLPSDAENIILGIPVDRNDPSKGWVGLDIPAMDTEDEIGSKKKLGGKRSVLNASPLGAGLRDGSLLAFKFRSEDAKKDDDGLDLDDSDWDVIMPSYDEE